VTRVAVARNKFARGFERSGDDVALAYEIVELRAALERVYSTDAHLVTYVVDGAERQPRINKGGLPYFEKAVSVESFFCDIDNPDHARWDDALLASAMQQYEELPAFETAGLYLTAHGRRVVQPLAEPIPAQAVEPYLRRWLLALEDQGLPVDWACRDWTRHFRLPHVRRSGVNYRSPRVRLERMRPIALEPLPAITDPAPDSASALLQPSAPLPLVDWSADVPEHWQPRVRQIARAVSRVETEWHTLFLALAGALMTRGAPAERVPVLCRAISLATGADTRTRDRELAARTTVQKRLAGLPATGYGELARTWPEVADALDAATARGTEAQLRAQAALVAEKESLDQAAAALEEALRYAPDGLTVISAECGLGKTKAAIAVAAERAAMGTQGPRAPLGSKTAISVDKNTLAQQVALDLFNAGTPVRRIYGPLSVLREDGTPECRFAEVAAPLVAGGQAMQWELCRGRDLDPCTFFDTCGAREGMSGSKGARVTVGTHALISELNATAGTTGLLVIDEPPDILETESFTLDDFETARGITRAFEGRYIGALTPAIVAAHAWLRTGETGLVTELEHIVRACAAHVPVADLEQARRSSGSQGDAIDCARAAPFPEGRPTEAPPLESAYVAIVRGSVARAIEIGTASRLLKALHHALTSDTPVAIRVEERRAERVLILTRAREDFAAALRRQGPVVVTDANGEIHLPIYARVVGYQPRHLRFAAGDGAPIERTLIRSRSATRRSWLPRGKLAIKALVPAVRALCDWLSAAPATSLGIITMRPVELALRAAHRFDVVADWKALGQKPETLDEVIATLTPLFAGWQGEIVFGHYGAVRGLNTMADVDALATLGDPWPNLGDIRNDVAFLGLAEAWEARLEALCRAELEQAHGRLRAVHRTRPGRALHIGNVLPSGSGWQSGDVRFMRMPEGRPKGAACVIAELEDMVLRLGGVRAVARALDCDASTISRYLTRKRGVPASVAAQLRDLRAEAADAR